MNESVLWSLGGLFGGMVLFLLILTVRRRQLAERFPSFQPTTNDEIHQLRQILLVKLLFDESELEQRLESERRIAPSAGEVEWYRSALAHWEQEQQGNRPHT